MRGVLSVAACFFLACFVKDVTESSDTGTVGGSGPGTSTGGSTTGTGGDGAGVCTDGVQNGDETDVDCGGGCDPCVDGLLCSEHADCEGVCVLGVCERAVVVSGTAKAANAVVDDYATSDSVVRIDFAAEPSVRDDDGDAITLPKSTGSWTLASITPASGVAKVVVGSIQLPNTTGETRYQTIDPDFFGVDLWFEDGGSAEAGAVQLIAAGLDGTVVEIYIVDTTP